MPQNKQNPSKLFFLDLDPNDTVLETFMDTYTVHKALELNATLCSVRVENRCLDIYPNEKDWLIDLLQKNHTKGLWESETAEIPEFPRQQCRYCYKKQTHRMAIPSVF